METGLKVVLFGVMSYHSYLIDIVIYGAFCGTFHLGAAALFLPIFFLQNIGSFS